MIFLFMLVKGYIVKIFGNKSPFAYKVDFPSKKCRPTTVHPGLTECSKIRSSMINFLPTKLKILNPIPAVLGNTALSERVPLLSRDW